MADIRMRPQFDFEISCDYSTTFQRLAEELDRATDVTGQVFPDSAVLKIPQAEVHLWTPQLQVSVEKRSGGGCQVHGLIGPRPSVWSLFLASYVFWTFLGTMAVIFGFSQWSLSEPAWAFWGGPLAVGGIAMTYVTARIGRRIGRPQSRRLKSFLEKAVRSS